MEKTGRHVHLRPFFGGQRTRVPAAVGSALGAQVDDDVERAAPDDTDELCHPWIAVKPSQNVAVRKGKIILNEGFLNSAFAVAPERVGFLEKPPLVAQGARP